MTDPTAVKFDIEVPVDQNNPDAPSATSIMEIVKRHISSLFPAHNFIAKEISKWQNKLSDREQADLDAEIAAAKAIQDAKDAAEIAALPVPDPDVPAPTSTNSK